MFPVSKKARLENLLNGVNNSRLPKAELEEGEERPPMVEGGSVPSYNTCHQCQKVFWSETSLKHHSSLYHSEKAFVCEICGKAFRFRSNLAEHRSVHTSLKPYVCKFCGKSSRLKGNLTKHILKHHKKEQNAYIGKDDIIIKKGKKSVKDPLAIDFLEKSMIVLTTDSTPIPSAALHLYTMAQIANSTASNGGADTSDLTGTPDSILMGGAESMSGGNPDPDDDSGRESSSGGSDIQNLVIDTTKDLPESADLDEFSGESDRCKLLERQLGADLCLSIKRQGLHNRHQSTPQVSSGDSPDICVEPQANMVGALGNSTRCNMCGKHFRKSTALALHMTLKHGFPPTSCAAEDTSDVSEQTTGIAANTSPKPFPPNRTIGIASPPPLKVGNHFALMNGHGSTAPIDGAPLRSPNGSTMTATVTPSPSVLSNDLRELKEVLKEIRLSSSSAAPDNGIAKMNVASKLESLLLSLDTRVGRLEKQVESSLNSLYSLIQLQSTMNSAFARFREDISGQLRSMQNLLLQNSGSN